MLGRAVRLGAIHSLSSSALAALRIGFQCQRRMLLRLVLPGFGVCETRTKPAAPPVNQRNCFEYLQANIASGTGLMRPCGTSLLLCVGFHCSLRNVQVSRKDTGRVARACGKCVARSVISSILNPVLIGKFDRQIRRLVWLCCRATATTSIAWRRARRRCWGRCSSSSTYTTCTALSPTLR